MDTESSGINLKLKTFEGPFELLIHLIEKNKINLYDIQIAELTDQYLDYLQAMRNFDMEIASEFLVMASTLLHIKSKMLLPVSKDTEEEEEEVDPREELILNLIEYKRIKQAAETFGEHFGRGRKQHYKLPEVYEFPKVYREEELNPFELVDTYIALLQRRIEMNANKTQASKIKTIVKKEKSSIKSRIKKLMKALFDKPKLKFSEVFGTPKESKDAVVTGLMASLELSKAKKVLLKQKKQFEDIDISLVKKSGDTPDLAEDLLKTLGDSYDE